MRDKHVAKCHTCIGDHCTSRCRPKDTRLAGGKVGGEKRVPGKGHSGKLFYLL